MTIAARDVRWNAGGRMIVDGVTLAAAPGRMLGVVGPNGSGKSSLLRLLCGLRNVGSGVVTLDGGNIRDLPRRAIARRIASVEQHAGTQENVTVEDVVRLGRTPYRGALSPWTEADEAAFERALAQVGMDLRRNQPWATLSGGERQRTQIARALAQEPGELILDEPTNHLDVRHQLDVLSLVRRLGITSIVALHDLNLAALFCDEVAVLNEGRLVRSGPPAAVLTAALIQEVFGVRAEVHASAFSGRPHIEYRLD
ncbi:MULTISPECIES: ABC transporter ATP-binding protein [unclassified Methylobacterium]|uniref:ABC transporter ATP-binding protein n=1 Tax=unclassified Methylobacterium TaxID=2615210 RepID=UPI0011C1D4B0|nr:MULTISPECIES: ABC transporter ATP-binding protein [unclassified Methylobacterium]QEE40668.1 ABC transporter ATP-binding protein [Methylobacterium sp. WL1]TXN58008.1 ABC transporter ATP-binding protein [Methylobacterium sp. WL2]